MFGGKGVGGKKENHPSPASFSVPRGHLAPPAPRPHRTRRALISAQSIGSRYSGCGCDRQDSGVPDSRQRNARLMQMLSQSRQGCAWVPRETDASLGQQLQAFCKLLLKVRLERFTELVAATPREEHRSISSSQETDISKASGLPAYARARQEIVDQALIHTSGHSRFNMINSD